MATSRLTDADHRPGAQPPVEDPLSESVPSVGVVGFERPSGPSEATNGPPTSLPSDAHPSAHLVRGSEDVPTAPSTTHGHDSSFASAPFSAFAPAGQIGRHKPRDIIRIDRTYDAGEICQFWSGFPSELAGRVSPTQHVSVVNDLNAILASAHDPYKSIIDNCAAVLTLYLSTLLGQSHFERQMAKFYDVVDRANREVYMPAGLRILDPRPVAFLYLEIEFY